MTSKPALLIYNSGAIWPTNRVYPDYQMRLEQIEMDPPMRLASEHTPVEPIRYHVKWFIRRGTAGPYSIWEESA